MATTPAASLPPPAAAPTPGIVSFHGRLRAEKARIFGAHGNPVSLAGNSFFWSQWQGKYYTPEVVGWLKTNWRSTIVRAALGVKPECGNSYLQHPAENLARVTRVIDAAIAEDIYVIIDWHDHEAHLHTAQAVAFFTDMARRYGHQPHVIYEIFNEPLEVSWVDDVKPYAEQVIAAIRAIDAENLIIVGSPHWSQDVDVAAADPVKGANIAYSLHFYAGTHKQTLRNKAMKAMELGAALFVTEWGACNADGTGPIDHVSVKHWMAFMREYQLSHCVWSVSDKKETASIITPAASPEGSWNDADLTESGLYARHYIRNWPGDVAP
jgi:aryl-phospho-beta-D-glucosidase BglC (GH1 family)